MFSVRHVVNTTHLFLLDHLKLKHQADQRRYWNRILQSKFLNETITIEPIPIYLTPDKERGINYTNNIIEMKGKMVLETYLPPPKELFSDDKFDYNDELITLNKIGTMRYQYDWHPTMQPEDYMIEDHVLDKIGPVLRFLNHGGQLLSTKVNEKICDQFCLLW
jgi:hypothetical protein